MARICILIVLIGMSASIKGKCLNDNSTTTANPFLISKWEILYKSADVNHDGKVSIEDAEESVNTFSDLEHLDAEKAKVVKEAFTKYWDECIFLGRNGNISEHELVDSFKKDFNANTEEFVKEKRRCFELIFSAIDINEDKSISKDEFQIAYTAFGHPEIAKDNGYFSAYGPKDGLVPLCDIVDYWVDFLTSTNESKGNFIKSGFDVDGFE